MFWDHPRLRGEYAELYLKQPQKQGSPPLARGILPAALPIFGANGITPACAGNTNYVNDSRWNRRDHPRLRGEYPRRHLPRMSCLGSPPLARGIQVFVWMLNQRLGITPACAGNTLKESLIYSIFPLSAAKFHLVSHILEMS